MFASLPLLTDDQRSIHVIMMIGKMGIEAAFHTFV